jgi:hypothetical protein
MADYGEVDVRREDDGSLTVVRADQRIGITAGLLVEAAGAGLATDAAGRLVVAGQVRYTPVGFDLNGRVVICEKVG